MLSIKLNTALCFIAIIPDSEICSEVREFQEYVSEHFNSSRVLRAPPHITLEPPFRWEVGRFQELASLLQEFSDTQESFSVQLKHFGAFPPRVVFVNVVETDALKQFHSAIKLCLRSEFQFQSERPDRPFRPHMTVAFRDLTKQMFHNARDHFSNIEYRREFVVDQFFLLQHDGYRWNKRESFKFARC